MDAAIIRQGELVNRGIMAYETTEEVGSVEHLLVDVKAARVTGLMCKSPGLMGRRLALAWEQLVKIGGDRIIIKTEVPETSASLLAAAQDITHLEVWTDGGDLIGQIVDVCFDQRTGQVENYLFALKSTGTSKAIDEDRLVDEASEEQIVAALYGEQVYEKGEYTKEEQATEEASLSNAGTEVFVILPAAIISAGQKRMMISEEDAKAAKPYTQRLNLSPQRESGGLRPERLAEQLPLPADLPTDFGELLQKGQSLAGEVSAKVRERAKKFTDEQLADREFGEAGTLPEITEQLQEKTEQVRQQMQERLGKAKERAQEKIEKSGLEERLDQTLGKTSFGRSLGKQLNKFKRPQPPTDPIDVESFEVWEDD